MIEARAYSPKRERTESNEHQSHIDISNAQKWSIKPLARTLLQDVITGNFNDAPQLLEPSLVTPLSNGVAEKAVHRLGLSGTLHVLLAGKDELEEKLSKQRIQKLTEEDTLEEMRAVVGYQWLKPPVDTPILSQQLTQTITEAEHAQQSLVRQYIRLATHLSSRQARQYHHRELPVFDPEAEGYVGLVKAAQRFDWRKGYSFTTFASSSITGEIQHAFRDKAESIRLPRAIYDANGTVRQAERELLAEQEQPTDEKLADKTGLKVAHIRDVRTSYLMNPVSLNAAVSAKDEIQLSETIAADSEPVEEGVVNTTFLTEALSGLPERDRRILLYRFYANMSQDEIAEREGHSQMHISRIISKAIKTIRAMLPEEEQGIVARNLRKNKQKS